MTSDDKAITAALSCVGAALLIPGMMIVAYLLNGWVLTILWGWFVVPLFRLPPLGLAYAVGISMLVGYLTYQHVPEDTKPRSALERLSLAVSRIIVSPLFTLCAAWVVHQFIV